MNVSRSRELFEAALRKANLLKEWRRDFHRHPELAYEEQRSSSIIADLLNSWGYEVKTGIAETGILASLSGRSGSSGVLLRVDMDALPIQEQNEVEYASEVPGVMHACGHDGHMAIGLGVADILRSNMDQLDGDVHIIFQPAEEGGGGAERMIYEQVLSGIDADIVLGVHLWNEMPLGWFGITSGPTMAGAERFEMRVIGKGAHGGLPHLSRDPIVASAEIVTTMQTVMARGVDPLDSAVLSVTHIKGGGNFNVIPDEVYLEGTLRTFKDRTRTWLIQRLGETAERIAAVHGCQVELAIDQVAPPVINDPQHARFVRNITEQLFPAAQIDSRFQVMVSEDIAYFLDQIPGVFLFVGSANPDEGLTAGHHTAHFNFDEEALIKAVALLSSVIWEKLSAHE